MPPKRDLEAAPGVPGTELKENALLRGANRVAPTLDGKVAVNLFMLGEGGTTFCKLEVPVDNRAPLESLIMRGVDGVAGNPGIGAVIVLVV
jgi:hypothetical protein